MGSRSGDDRDRRIADRAFHDDEDLGSTGDLGRADRRDDLVLVAVLVRLIGQRQLHRGPIRRSVPTDVPPVGPIVLIVSAGTTSCGAISRGGGGWRGCAPW